MEKGISEHWATKEIEPWIRTMSGGRFYPFNPRVEDVSIQDIAHALSNQCRFSGHVKEFYSVAQHSVHVADILKSEDQPIQVQLAGLLHDAGEAYMVDMPTPIKRQMPQFKEVETKIQAAIKSAFSLPESKDAIKRADLIMLRTEARDLMGDPQDWISFIDLPDPLPKKVVPWSPSMARYHFLARFAQLNGKK